LRDRAVAGFDQGFDNAATVRADSPNDCAPAWHFRVKRFFLQRWFLLLLVAALAGGICFAEDLQPLSRIRLLRDSVVATVLFVMALPLEAHAMWRTMKRPLPPLLAVLVTFGLLPLLAWALSGLMNDDLGVGLLVAATTPSTLASAAVWTRRAGGNDAVAILVTIMTNLACFVVMPLWLLAMTGAKVESPELSLSKMAAQLAWLVVVPMALAQCLRLYRPVGAWATRRKLGLGVLAQCGILFMVLLGSIGVGLRLRDTTQAALELFDVLLMLAIVCAVHTVMLYAGLGLARLLRCSREEQIAVAFSGSQKTLMVGLFVAMSLQVSILPMLAYHVSQLFIDTLIADRFREKLL